MDQEDNAPEFDPFAEPSTRSKAGSGGRLIASLALLVALAVAGWNGWTWWQSQQDAGMAADLERAMADLRSTQAAMQRDQAAQATRLDAVERLELAAGLAQLDEAVEQAQSVAGSDRARLEGLEENHDDTQQRLDAVEGRLAAVVVRGESPRQALDLAEIDYLLRSANERLPAPSDPEILIGFHQCPQNGNADQYTQRTVTDKLTRF